MHIGVVVLVERLEDLTAVVLHLLVTENGLECRRLRFTLAIAILFGGDRSAPDVVLLLVLVGNYGL